MFESFSQTPGGKNGMADFNLARAVMLLRLLHMVLLQWGGG